MRKIGRGLFFNQLQKFKVKDKQEKKIGHIGDLLLSKDDMAVHAFIIYGSRLEERLEAMHLRDDVDEIVPINKVDSSRLETSIIHITVEKSELEVTHAKWEPPSNLLLYSRLKKANVYDKDNSVIGHICDIIFHSEGNYSVVIHPRGEKADLMDRLHLTHSHDIIVPDTYITSIGYEGVHIRIEQPEMEDVSSLPVKNMISKSVTSFEKPSERIKRRFHYVVLEADLANARAKLKEKEPKFMPFKSLIEIQEFNPGDKGQLVEFVDLYNEIAITGVDPYKEMTEQDACEHFASGTYIAYSRGIPIGYCMLSTKERDKEKIGAIAGIGVHHKHRGKRYSTLLMDHALQTFNAQNIEKVQCDILVQNEASFGLFKGLGFEEIDDFYLG